MVITVGGTNGKGSCCAMLEGILLASGYRVGCYTSPHLLRYNERVRIDGRGRRRRGPGGRIRRRRGPPGDTAADLFRARHLAAWQVFAAAGLDVIILESASAAGSTRSTCSSPTARW